MLEELIYERFTELNLKPTEKQVKQFIQYKDLIIEWNNKINLTAIINEEDIVNKHFVDSLSCIKTGVINNSCKLIDIGTGAGFPGIPLKIMYPDMDITLLDSLNKRVIFLNEVINKLKLSKIYPIHGRAEDLARDNEYRELYDIAVSRAVAELPVLLEYSLPYVKLGGYFIGMKGPSLSEEISKSNNALNILGGEIKDIININLPQTDIEHKLLIVKKIKKCPTKYPRKAGSPLKNPL
jgi:16S rRNA (guanine527-N7)-methyltransferase